MSFDRQYKILPTSIGQYPPTGSNDYPISTSDTVNLLKASALRLSGIASLLELYDKPGGLDEAVETLEAIAKFHK